MRKKLRTAIPIETREAAEEDPAGQLQLDKRDILFLSEYAKHKNLRKAANKAFGDSEKKKHDDPVKHAHSLMTRKAYDRAVVDYWTNIYGCTDAFLIRELAKGVTQLTWDREEGPLKLNCMKLMLDLKRMLPDKGSRQEKVSQTNVDKMQQIIINGVPLQEVIGNIRTHASEEDLQNIITKTVDAVALPSVSKKYVNKDLFASRSDLNQEKGDKSK